MIVTPYSALDTSADLAPTQANFPCLKHFWKCDEAAGSNPLVDAIAGSNFPAVTLTKPDAYSVDGTYLGSALSAESALFTNIGTTPFIFLAVGKFAAATVNIQDQTTGAIVEISQAGAKIAADGVTFRPAILTTFTNNSDTRGRAIVVTAFGSATGMQQVECDVDGTTTNTQKDISGSAASLPFTGTAGNQAALTIGSTSTALYGMALFTFTAIPANYAAALSWMSYQWSVGNKVIYPGWKGIS